MTAREPAAGRYRVELVEKTFAVLDAFAPDARELSLREVVERSGQSQSSVYRILATLAGIGIVERDGLSGRYRIGSKLYAIGSLAVLDLRRLALPYMEALRKEFAYTVGLSAFDADGGILVEVLEAPGPYGIALSVGGREPLHCTGSGKCALAFAAPAERAAMLGSLQLVPHTPDTIVDRAELEAELEAVARAGYALDRGEWAPHVRCAAVPVRDRRSRVTGALSVVGTAGMDQAPTLPLLIRRLTDAAAALSRELGYDEQLDSVLP